jgi:hypothetical protein
LHEIADGTRDPGAAYSSEPICLDASGPLNLLPDLAANANARGAGTQARGDHDSNAVAPQVRDGCSSLAHATSPLVVVQRAPVAGDPDSWRAHNPGRRHGAPFDFSFAAVAGHAVQRRN